MKNTFILSITLILLGFCSTAQQNARKCLSHFKQQQLMAKNPAYAKAVAQRKTIPNSTGKRTLSEAIYTIPVVVHVIHNGEAIGQGQNISDAQINSAITALNNDFRSLNADTLAPNHPWYSLQADVKIEFCLAKQDEQGATTTGILRYNKGKVAWEADDFDQTIKPTTIWDPTKYMNIWTTTFGGADEYTLGYANFPEGASSNNDGLVIGATYFGTEGNVEFGVDKNRTATHEVGHYLGLYHIWGDESCGTDLVDDTPIAFAANESNCPTFPHNVSSTCNPGANGEMFMNYMDYTLDNCMQLFTTGQKTRMRSQFEQYRISLNNSVGCDIPTQVNFIDANKIKVYPNPASSTVTINAPANFSIGSVEIFDINGAQVSAMKGAGPILQINTSSLSNGNYFIKITSEGGVINKALTIIQ